MNYCLWLLGRRAHTEAELRERLARKEVDAEAADRIIGRLADWGYVNDAEFSRQFVRSRSRRWGELRLRSELRHKGVEEGTAERELEQLTEDDQLGTARDLLERNAWRFRRSDEARRDRARAWAFLARRGFPPPVVAEAVEGFAFGKEAAAASPETDSP